MPSLEEFRSHLKTIGFAKSSNFLVEFYKQYGASNPNISMLVDAVVFPGLNIMTAEYRTFGEIRESPYGISYQPVNLSIILDNVASAKSYFDDWSNEVFNRDYRTTGYYNDFIRDVAITMHDINGKAIYRVVLKEAYPKMVGDISMDYANKDIVRLNVSLAFKYWVKEDLFQTGVPIPFNTEDESSFLDEADLFGLSANSPTPEFSLLDDGFSYYDFGSNNPVGSFIPGGVGIPGERIDSSLYHFGQQSASSIARSCQVASTAFGGSSMAGAPTFASNFTDMSSRYVQYGGGLSSLGQNLQNITAPVSAIADSVYGITSVLGSINGLLSSVGLGSPFSGIINNMNSTAGRLGVVGGLNGVPGHIGSIGAAIIGAGGIFSSLSSDVNRVPGSTPGVSTSLQRLGFNMERQGINNVNAADALQRYVDTQ